MLIESQLEKMMCVEIENDKKNEVSPSKVLLEWLSIKGSLFCCHAISHRNQRPWSGSLVECHTFYPFLVSISSFTVIL